MQLMSKEAVQVHTALLERGLETPLTEQIQPKDDRKIKIAQHMQGIMQLLNLDLSDDSLSETPQRVAKMYVDEIFSIRVIFGKLA